MKKLTILAILYLLNIPLAYAGPVSTETGSANLKDKSVYLEVVNSSPAEIEIAIKTKEINSIFGAAIKLKYDPRVLTYAEYKLGKAFEQPEVALSMVGISQKVNDELVIGLSLKRGEKLLDKSGELLILQFKLREINNTKLDFIDSSLVTFNKEKTDEIKGINWIALNLEMETEEVLQKQSMPTKLQKTGPGIWWLLSLSVLVAVLVNTAQKDDTPESRL